MKTFGINNLFAIAALLASLPASATTMSLPMCAQGAENSAETFVSHELTVDGATVNALDKYAATVEFRIDGKSGDVTLVTPTTQLLLGRVKTLPQLTDGCEDYAVEPSTALTFKASTHGGFPLPSLNPDNFFHLEREFTSRVAIFPGRGAAPIKLMGETTQELRKGRWE